MSNAMLRTKTSLLHITTPRRPRVDQKHALHLAKSVFHLSHSASQACIKELNGYEDRNFYIEGTTPVSPCQNGFLLKVTNSVDSKNSKVLRTNSDLLFFLNDHGINCPVPQTSRNGDTIAFRLFSNDDSSVTNDCKESAALFDVELEKEDKVKENEESSAMCAVRLFSFVEGKLLYDVPSVSEDLLFDCGKKVAKLHRLLKEFSNHYPTSRTILRPEFLWNLRNEPEVIKNFSHALDNSKREELVRSISRRFERVLPKLEDLEPQLIHGDINEQNIIVEEDGKGVFGFIDFNDIHFSYRVLDLAICIAYVMMLPNLSAGMSVRTAVDHVIDGYQSEWSLSREELEMLEVCALARCCQSLVIGAYQHKYFDPENDYLLTTSKKGWQVLFSWGEINED